ncbi:hypothetical protein FHR83_007614 [Actinoplanes campanulatus]|uniref:Repeat domain-containing protein n=1 Tax=Actinoplanes campanulatus TaxID=113559 RepID=A0A7W5APB8_9ACTN|nr:FG-GAP-like repeat-containing protein [Actinoplanes campanulatus]MBB3099898.1 hypothetical protein [Actinoplanes campanulatus]GGN48070.1 hypothetical protein GCM10010109_84910 [Actinoplanes campanulatus]GID40458.1 hypothetical protein Aca09nite_69640 [Actinoplanes campanulatus]
MSAAGGDSVRLSGDLTEHAVAGTITVLDLSTRSWSHPALPAGDTILNLFGDTLLVRPAGATATLELRRAAEDGTWRTVPMSGLPDGAIPVSRAPWGVDATGAEITFRLPAGGVGHGLLDLRTGRVSPIPAVPGIVQTFLSETHVGYRVSGAVLTFARSAIVDGTATTPVTIPIPAQNVPTAGTFLVGGDVLIRPTVSGAVPAPVTRYAADTAPRQVLADSQTPDFYSATWSGAGVLMVGGAGPRDWAVHRFTAAASGPVLPVARPAVSAGLTLSRGTVRQVTAVGRFAETPRFDLTSHSMLTGSSQTTSLTGAHACVEDTACIRTVDGSAHGTAYLTGGAASTVVRYQDQVNSSKPSVLLEAGGGTIVDASYGWTVVNTTTPARQYIFAPGASTRPSFRAVTGAALWQDTLWTATPGRLEPKNLVTNAAGTAVSTGSPCTATEVQATHRYLYWACGTDGPAGVHDLARKVTIPVPADRYLLGDGFLARHDAGTGDLLRYDLTGGSLGDPAVLGTFARGPVPDDRNIGWAVDRYSGHVAYADSAHAVHVVDPGVARSAPVGTHNNHSWLLEFGSGRSLPIFALNRPVSAWKVTITQLGTGAVVATRTGGSAVSNVVFDWDGLLPNRKRAVSGVYLATLTATADGRTVTAGSARFSLWGGAPKLHSYERGGESAILGVKKSGEGHWLIDQVGRDALWDNGYTEHWTGVSAIVPFGDVNQDYNNDLLVRRTNGTLYAHLGIGQSHFGGRQAVRIGTGWNQYDLLLTSGDLTGDGIADLLARNRKTGYLYRFNGTGRKSFSRPVRVPGSYRTYARLIGPGDLNGDGRADLLSIDRKGVLYVQFGTGAGAFGARKKLASGMGGYNAVIGAGDLNEDGRNDLVVRDRAGVLYRHLGTGRGTFGGRQKIGSGYQRFAYLF